MSYNQRIRVTRTTEGTHDPVTRVFTPGTELVLYDGGADVQDRPRTLRRGPSGEPLETSDADVFLEDETQLAAIAIDDVVHITWEDGTTDDAIVRETSRLDGRLMLGWAR